MRLFVTGATGFTGRETLTCLLEAGHSLRCLYRSGSNRPTSASLDMEWVYGDLSDRKSLTVAMAGCDGLINIASLGFGHADNILNAAMEAELDRAIFISTTAIFTKLNASSKAVRLRAEELIMASPLNYTILRPTMIYGSRRDRNISRLIQFIKKFPLIPVAGDGTFKQQPVYVGDVAAAICSVIEKPATFRQCFNIAGGDAISYNEMIDIIAGALGKRARKIHLPAGLLTALLSSMEKTGIRLPIKSEQILRLNEDKVFDNTPASLAFNYHPRSFSEGIQMELEQMKVVKA